MLPKLHRNNFCQQNLSIFSIVASQQYEYQSHFGQNLFEVLYRYCTHCVRSLLHAHHLLRCICAIAHLVSIAFRNNPSFRSNFSSLIKSQALVPLTTALTAVLRRENYPNLGQPALLACQISTSPNAPPISTFLLLGHAAAQLNRICTLLNFCNHISLSLSIGHLEV